MAKRALVTGGAGFIGSHLVQRLLEEGWQTRILDNFQTGTPDNLRPWLPDIEVIEGDVRDQAVCLRACQGVDSVFHLAAIASVASSVEDPWRSHEVTLGGTLTMLLAARDQAVRRFVFSSSAAVYGNAETVPTREDQPLAPQSPYASAKAAGELYCHNFSALYGLETVCLRYFNVFGPRQSAHSGYAAAIPLFVRAALHHAAPTIFGDGLQTRDFVAVSNVAQANLRAAQVAGIAGQTFNIASGSAISLLALLEELRQITGAELAPTFAPARAGEVRHSRADITRALTVLGYTPAVSFAEGLRLTVTATQSLCESFTLSAV